MNTTRLSQFHRQTGASAVEFTVVALVLFIIGMGTLQAGLLYHSKTIINYATFEAARVGATQHAMMEPMREELGIRLAPLYGGDGTLEKASIAIARSSVEIDSPITLDGSFALPTEVKILNPTIESFERWGRPSLEYLSKTAIPNSHLKHQPENEGAGTPGMTLADANLLKIQVTHGVELTVPFVNKIITSTLLGFENVINDPDPIKIAYYRAGRIPVTSTATVRMQSEAWKDETVNINAEMPFQNPSDTILGFAPGNPDDGATGFNPIDDSVNSGCNSNGLSSLIVNLGPPGAAICEFNPVGEEQASPVPSC